MQLSNCSSNQFLQNYIKKFKYYGLLGPNGAGKSTFIKMLKGIITPSFGQILFEEKPLSRKDLLSIGALMKEPR